jgi:hypothetical protein
MKFSLFRKQKQQKEPEKQAAPPQEQPEEEAPIVIEEPKQETPAPEVKAPEGLAPVQEIIMAAPEKKLEIAESQSKIYLKAMSLKDVKDVENVKEEINNGNIIILRVTPLANKSLDDVKNAVNELYQFSGSVGGDIARLGEERVVICPKNIRIWREKTPAQTDNLPTAAPTAA